MSADSIRALEEALVAEIIALNSDATLMTPFRAIKSGANWTETHTPMDLLADGHTVGHLLFDVNTLDAAEVDLGDTLCYEARVLIEFTFQLRRGTYQADKRVGIDAAKVLIDKLVMESDRCKDRDVLVPYRARLASAGGVGGPGRSSGHQTWMHIAIELTAQVEETT